MAPISGSCLILAREAALTAGQNGYLSRVVDHVVQDSLGYWEVCPPRECGPQIMTGRRHASEAPGCRSCARP